MSDTLHADAPLATGNELCDLSAVTLLDLQRKKSVSAVEILDAHLSRIDTVNPQVNALVTIADPVTLRARAAEIDSQWSRGIWQGPLHGLPVSQKDLTATQGVRTTFGSKIFKHHVPQHSALIARRCDAAGALMIGKSNTPEFGAGSHTFNEEIGRAHV